MKPRPGDFTLTIRPEPDGLDALGRDPMYRLRILLKRALRSYGWRCVDGPAPFRRRRRAARPARATT